MPKVRRKDIPPALFAHLLDRIQERRIDARQLGLLAEWLDGEPEVPTGPWFKRFPGMIVCGEGDLIKTFLLPGQSPKEMRVGQPTVVRPSPCDRCRTVPAARLRERAKTHRRR